MQHLSPTDFKHVNEFVMRFLHNPAQPGISLERVQHAKGKGVWSGRVTSDLRAILHKDGDNWILLYAGHHDDAYDWASRRQVECHPSTGVLQIVESPERFAESLPPAEQQALFQTHSDDYLLSLGVPQTWLPTLRKIDNEDQLLEAAGRLPSEVGERLLALAAGEFVTPPAPVASPLDNPDARRRFFVVETDDDLLRILEAPLARWLVFLHPSQRALVEGSFKGAVKVTGSAGTGKTVVAMHRARHLARQGKRVLLTTFVTTLCHDIERNLKLLCSADELSRIVVSTVHNQAMELVRQVDAGVQPVNDDHVESLIGYYHGVERPAFEASFLYAEWKAVVRPQGILTWDAYRDAGREGRGRALSVKQRKEVWRVLGRIVDEQRASRQLDWSSLCRHASELLNAGSVQSPFDACVVDELQDLGPQEIRFVAALAGSGPDRLMLVGDGGQRIYGHGLSLRACGIDVRGRSHVLRLNYRTTEQIRKFADRILDEKSDDLDGGRESRRGTRSLLKGPVPVPQGFKTDAQQVAFIAEQIERSRKGGVACSEMAVFARTNKRVDNLQKQLQQAGLPTHRLSREDGSDGAQGVNFGTMHRAKGLEFKVVFVADCSADEVPLKSVLKALDDAADREEALALERQLLYVSMTRARDELYVTWVGEKSPFLGTGPR